MRNWRNRFAPFIAAFLVATGAGCASSEQEESGNDVVEAEEGSKDEGGSESAAEPTNDAPAMDNEEDQGTSDLIDQMQEAAEQADGANAGYGDPATADSAAPESEEAAQWATEASAPAPTGSSEPRRVLRYVKESGTPIRTSPEAEADEVGSLKQGQRVIVIEDGDWSRVKDGMYIKADRLTPEAVPREHKKAEWQPAH